MVFKRVSETVAKVFSIIQSSCVKSCGIKRVANGFSFDVSAFGVSTSVVNFNEIGVVVSFESVV